jgi:hypothetical protein
LRSFCKRFVAIRTVLFELGMALGELTRHNKPLKYILCPCSPNGRRDEKQDCKEAEKILGSHSAPAQ